MRNLTRQCNFCGAAAIGKPQQPYDNGVEIVREAKYVCPRCNRFFAKEILERAPKKVEKK